MTTITREWLQKTIADMEVTRDDIPFGFDEDQSNTLAALKIALASLDAEPVRYLNKFSGTCVTLEQQSNAADDVAVYIPLYATPPAPVVPEKMNFSTACNFVQINGMAKEDRTILAMRAWNACRAAMLNGGKS
ncbi:Eaa protein [Salmonella enterica]